MAYFCGWDGGGTKTAVRVVDEQGNLVGEKAFGPLNTNGAGADVVASSISDSLNYMKELAGSLDAYLGLCVGSAGISNANAYGFLETGIRQGGYKGNLRIVGDQEIALAGALEGRGAVLIAGTGSVCTAKDAEGKLIRVGGWGYLIDDGGSGYAIGRDILTATVQMEDGRGKQTCLHDMVFEKLGVTDIKEIIAWLYAPSTGKKGVATLSPLLLQALEQGDAVACEIADREADVLTEMALTIWKRASLAEGELALVGSILSHYPRIRNRLERNCQAVYPGMRLIEPHGTAAEGAVKLAMEL